MGSDDKSWFYAWKTTEFILNNAQCSWHLNNSFVKKIIGIWNYNVILRFKGQILKLSS